MNQQQTIEIIKELGGSAIFNDIVQKAIDKKIINECSASSTVQHVLFRLTNNDTLKRKLVEKNPITHSRCLEWSL